jgi:hypothetical protein
MMATQKKYKSNVPWTRYLCDYQECQERLIKSTLVNFWKSRGMKAKANNIQMDKDLDLNEEKVKALLGKDGTDDIDAKIMAKIEDRLKSMVTREKMNEQSESFKKFGQNMDQKLNMIHNTLKAEVDELRQEQPSLQKEKVSKEDIEDLIRESQGTVLEEVKMMIKTKFPKGYDPELHEISSKTGNLTKVEIGKARAAILKFGSETGTAVLTQILGYGSERETLTIQAESAFLKSFITPYVVENPNGRYAQHILLENIKVAWAHLMSFLVNPGMINVTQIMVYGKTIHYNLCDLHGEDLRFTKDMNRLFDIVSVPQIKQIQNLECIRAIELLKPIGNTSKWSFNPINEKNELTRTMQTFSQLKLNRLMQIGYIDCDLTGDTLSNPRTRQCFPITRFKENGRNEYEAPGGGKSKKHFLNQGSASSGFFSQNLKEFY